LLLGLTAKESVAFAAPTPGGQPGVHRVSALPAPTYRGRSGAHYAFHTQWLI